MKSVYRLFVLPISIVFATLACLPGSAALEVLEEGEALPDGAMFRPVAFSSPLDGPSIHADFPGLSKVRATLRESDGTSGEARGKKVQTLKKQVDFAPFSDLEPGTYDLVVQQGAAKVVVDDIVVENTPVIVNSIIENLTIDFGGLENVRVDLRLDDGDAEAVGKGVWTAKSQSGIHTYPVLSGNYDVRIKVRSAVYIAHGIACESGPCSVSDIAGDLNVDFGGLTNMRLELRTDDGSEESVGKSVWTRTGQSDVQTYRVLRTSFDARVRHGAAERTVHGIDCTSGVCSVGELSRTLTVDLSGLENVRIDLRDSDGIEGSVGGSVLSRKAQSGLISFPVLRDSYDLRLRTGAVTHIVGDVDCTAADCEVGGVSETLTVNYGELSAVQLQLRAADGIAHRVGGSVWTRKAQSGSVDYEVLKGTYDLRFRMAASELIVDDVDCTAGPCAVSGTSQQLTVDLGEVTGARVQLRRSDGQPETAGGKVWTRKDQAGVTAHEVLRDIYDLQLTIDGTTHLVEDVDCYSGDCSVSFANGIATNHSPVPEELAETRSQVAPAPARVPAPVRVSPPTALTPEERERLKDVWIKRPSPTPVPPTPTPAVPPSKVTNIEVIPGDGEALITWDEPSSIGGSEIQLYRIVIIPLQRVEVINGVHREFLIEGLENGVAYRVQINAISADGFGERLLTEEFVPTADGTLSGEEEDAEEESL